MSEESMAHSGEEDTSRRGFLKIVIGVLAFLNGLILGIPFIKTLATPARGKKLPWQ
jgi:hypothetical protein